MQANKRQRDSRDEDGQSRKKPHIELRQRYQEPLTFAVTLVSGAKLDKGHITGILKEVTPNGSEVSLTIKDDESDKTISCIFSEFTSKVDDFNLRIGKRVKVALTRPERVPSKGSLHNKKYPFDLRFHQYCFTVDGQMFEDTKNKEKPSFLGGSDSEEEEPEPAVLQQVNRPARSAINHSASTSSFTSNEQRKGSSTGSLPSSLISIKDARIKPAGTLVNIAGVVHRVREARQFPATGQWGVEVHLRDQSCNPNENLEVKLYAARREYLPDLSDRHTGGDVAILLTKVKMQLRNGYSEAIGYTGKFRYCCFSKQANKLFAHSMDNQDLDTYQQAPVHACTEEETRALRRLVNGEIVDANPRRYESGIEEKLIEEIRVSDTFSCTVELLHTYFGNPNGSVDIRVTDYTSNPLLEDGDSSGYNFPRGNRTLRITLFDNPALQARTMEIGKIYRFPRVRFTEANGYRQGRCGNGQKGDVQVVLVPGAKDDLVKNLLARKRAYESGSPIPARAPRHSPPVAPRQPEPTKKKTASTKVDSGPAQASISTTLPAPASPPAIPRAVKVYPKFPEYNGELEACDLIVCAAPDSHPLKTLKEIGDSSECPAIFGSKGRIVDVEPSNLADAIAAVCTECGTVCKVEEKRCTSCKSSDTLQTRVRLEIIFQDASGELCTKVADETAEKFFRLSKSALQRGNQDELLQELSDRFQILMGQRPGHSRYEVGGLSEVMQLVVKSWHVKEPGVMWRRYHKLSGCRVNLGGT